MTIISNPKGAMMTINQSLKRIGYGSAIAPLFFIFCNPVLAQITPDST